MCSPCNDLWLRMANDGTGSTATPSSAWTPAPRSCLIQVSGQRSRYGSGIAWGPEGVAMTTRANGAAGRSGARVPGRGATGASAVGQLGGADRVARGKEARAAAPLGPHAEFQPTRSRDPAGLLLEQAQSRVPELVPIRHGRMLTWRSRACRSAASSYRAGDGPAERAASSPASTEGRRPRSPRRL